MNSPHPNPDDLRAFANGKLEPAANETVGRHIETCADCQRTVAESHGDTFLRRLRDAHAHPATPGTIAQPNRSPLQAELAEPAESPNTPTYWPISEGPGTVIGRYKLLQQIGEGGFGTVFMAEQTHPVRRIVALKIIKPGMDSAQVIARFESERQALALMDHTNIAKVFDAGATESGRPYFVMELVKGVPITEFCDKNHSRPEDRLKLFIDVCHAIQHAHHKGIIHRDIKPSNVMVTLHDGVPVVKVIDFGVAKATVHKLTEKTQFTAYGQMIGTPAYASPEQAEMSGLDIDTRSDIYSLGVLLYELLTGTTPIEGKRLRSVGYAEMQRLIREEEAPRPSTRLSSLGESATVLAGNRGLDVKRLMRQLTGDLDWVVMKALEKDRKRRYDTPGSFAQDIERYLQREAILARPPSLRYRFGKFVRRNKGPATAAIAIAVLLLLGIASTSIGLVWALSAERAATKAATGEAEQRTAAVTERDRARIAEAKAIESRDSELRQLYAADMLLVSRAVTDGPLSRAFELLDAWRPERRDGKDYRGQEWHLLRRLCDTSEKILIGHEGPLRALAWTKDGSRIASGGQDSVIRVWDAETGRCLQTLVGHSDGIHDLAFSPNGRLLASASADSTARIWSIDSGKAWHVLRGHILPVYAVAFHPDGKQVATAGGDTVVKVWDVGGGGKEQFTLQGHEAAVGRLQFDSTGKKLASSGIIRGTFVWDLETRKVVDRVTRNGDVVFTPDLATGLFPLAAGQFAVLDVKARTYDQGDLGGKGFVALDMNAATRIVAVSAADDTIQVVDRSTSSTLVTHRGHIGAARRVLLRADGRKLASAGDDGTVRIWNVPDPNEPEPYSRHHAHNVTASAFSNDGSLLASGDYLGSIAVWHSQTGNRQLKLGTHYLRRKSQKVPLEIGTGKPMEKGKIPLKNLTGFSASATAADPIVECFTSVGHGGEVKGLAFTPDKKVLVSAGAQDLIVWDLASGTIIREFEHPTLVSSLAISPDGTLAATGCWDDIVRIFRIPSGELVKQFEGHGDDVMSVAFHPNGKELASGSRDRTAIVWDIATGTIKHRLRRHVNTIWTVRYNPDGKRLVTGGMDKAVHVWNSDTGKLESTLSGLNDGITSLVFSTDGKWLVTASDGVDDLSARMWLWHDGRFREGAVFPSLGSRGSTSLSIHPVSSDLVIGRGRLTTFATTRAVEALKVTAEPVAPAVLQANAPADSRLRAIGYALVDEIAAWPNEKVRLKPTQKDGKFLVVAAALPFSRLKITDEDYVRLLEAKKKDKDENEPLKFSSMLIYPERFVLSVGDGKPLPAQFVGRMAKSEEEGFEFMPKGKSMLENMTVTPKPHSREHVYLAWEVGKDFSATDLRLRFETDEVVPLTDLRLETFRPGKPYHPAVRSFDAGEGGLRLRSNVSRSPGP
jgi:WD40 repeat protein/serine/threonine protein kinase